MIFYRHIALVCSGAVIEVNWNGNRGNSQKPGPTFGFYVILWFYVAVFAVCCWSVSFLWIIWSKQGQKVNTEIGFLIAFFLPCDRCLLCSFPVDQDSRMNVSISNLRDDVYFRRCFLTRLGFCVTNLYLWKLSQSDLQHFYAYYLQLDWSHEALAKKTSHLCIHWGDDCLLWGDSSNSVDVLFLPLCTAAKPQEEDRSQRRNGTKMVNRQGEKGGTELRYLEDHPMTDVSG